MKNLTNKLVAFALMLVASVAFTLGAPASAWANNELTVTNENGVAMHVSDAVTSVKVAKLDADKQEYLAGAQLSIIEKDTGNVVDSWTSTDTDHDSRKVLDVDKHYILRETSAPDGYSVATDTEFYIDAVEGGTVHIVSGDSAELYQSTTIKLYNKKGATVRQISVYKKGQNTTTKVKAPQTGDEAPLLGVTLAVVACLVSIAVIQVIKKRGATNED